MDRFPACPGSRDTPARNAPFSKLLAQLLLYQLLFWGEQAGRFDFVEAPGYFLQPGALVVRAESCAE